MNAMENKVKKYNKYKRDLKYMLSSAGLWTDCKDNPQYFKILLNIIAAFVNGAIVYGTVAFCVKHFTNVGVLTRGLGLMISFSSSFLKVLILVQYRKDLIGLNRGISSRFETDLETPEYRRHLLAYFPSFSRFFYTFDYSVAINLSMLVLTPLLAFRHGKYVRVFPILIPFNYKPGGVLHWTIYAFEALSAYLCWSITVGVDSLFGFYTLHMVGELRLLSFRLQKLKSGNDYRKDLKECIDRHNLLIESRHSMQRIFGFLSIWLAITCAVILCAIIFQTIETKNLTVYRAIYLVGYCFLKLVQAYSYAWFGNIIAIESDACLQSIYNANWPGSGDLRFMNDVLIMQSQNPMVFKAKGCMIVQLDMFSKIIHTSFSYFFLMRTLDETMGELS